jgi:hypothetical protein
VLDGLLTRIALVPVHGCGTGEVVSCPQCSTSTATPAGVDTWLLRCGNCGCCMWTVIDDAAAMSTARSGHASAAENVGDSSMDAIANIAESHTGEKGPAAAAERVRAQRGGVPGLAQGWASVQVKAEPAAAFPVQAFAAQVSV